MNHALDDILFLLGDLPAHDLGELTAPESRADLVAVIAVAMTRMGHEVGLHWCPITVQDRSHKEEQTVWALEVPDETGGVWVGMEGMMGEDAIKDRAEELALRARPGSSVSFGDWTAVDDLDDLAGRLDTINSVADKPIPRIGDWASKMVAFIQANRLDRTSPSQDSKGSSPRL